MSPWGGGRCLSDHQGAAVCRLLFFAGFRWQTASVFGILGSTADTVQKFEDFHYFLRGNGLRLHRHFFPSVMNCEVCISKELYAECRVVGLWSR